MAALDIFDVALDPGFGAVAGSDAVEALHIIIIIIIIIIMCYYH